MRLTLRLTLALFVGLAAALVVQALLRSRELVESQNSRAEEDLALLAHVLADAVEATWRANDPDAARSLVDVSRAKHPGLTIRWVELHAPSDTQPQLPPDALSPLTGGQRELVLRTADGTEPRLYVYRTLDLRGGEPQALELWRPLAQGASSASAIRLRELKLAAVLLVVLSLFTAAVSAILVGRPVEALRAQVRAVASGTPVEPHPVGVGELDEVAREVVEMSQHAQRNRAALVRDTANWEEAVNALRDAERLTAVGKMASIVAHELGTPLNVISARAAMIRSGESKDEHAIESAAIIVEQSNRMSRIIKEVLDGVRKHRPKRADVGVAALLTQSTGLLARMARRAHVRFERVGDLTDRVLYVDASRIVQVLTNLFTNSIQAMPNGGLIELEVVMVGPNPAEHRAPDGHCSIAVRDTGIGMSAAVLAKLFVPFFTTRGDAGGTGLGMAISEGIMSDHSGWIEVDSTVDVGTTFKLNLPLRLG